DAASERPDRRQGRRLRRRPAARTHRHDRARRAARAGPVRVRDLQGDPRRDRRRLRDQGGHALRGLPAAREGRPGRGLLGRRVPGRAPQVLPHHRRRPGRVPAQRGRVGGHAEHHRLPPRPEGLLMTNISVHRLLDDAFAGIAVTPDVQDLKEEIRANLLDRVAELTAQGVGADDAARRAVDELGDVRALVAEAAADAGARSPAAPAPAVVDAAAAAARQRVPVRPRYVVGVIVASVVILLAFVPVIWVFSLTAERAEAGWVPLVLAAPYLAGPGVGWIRSEERRVGEAWRSRGRLEHSRD